MTWAGEKMYIDTFCDISKFQKQREGRAKRCQSGREIKLSIKTKTKKLNSLSAQKFVLIDR